MIRTLSSEMSLESSHISNKTNRVPYMGCQSLLYQNRITKETVLRYNRSMNISMEEISSVPTSVLIHQANPQSIPSFSTYHSDDTVYNIRSFSNDTTKRHDSAYSIYDMPPMEPVDNKPNSVKPSHSVHMRKKPSELNLGSFETKRNFFPSYVDQEPLTVKIGVPLNSANYEFHHISDSNCLMVEPAARPNSYQTINCWDDFISVFSIHGPKNIYWTRRALKQPILNYVQKHQGKSAVKAFKIIQKYMGDRRTRKSPTQLFALLQKSFSHNEALRDEVLIQICKQTINNPDSRSSCRGWELLSECLLQFSPSQKLFPYLDDFILTSLNHEQRKNPSALNNSLTNLRKCEYHLSCSMKSYSSEVKDQIDSSIVTTCNHKRKRSLSDNNQNGTQVIYSPQTLAGLMKQQSFAFPKEEVPLELVTLCNQIAQDLDCTENFMSLYRLNQYSKNIKKASINLEKWFNLSCQKGPHLVDRKNIPNLQFIALHVLIYWFESLSQPVISQQMAFLTKFSIRNLTKINKIVLLYMVRFLQVNVINKSKDSLRNIASFLCSLIFQLPNDKFYPLESPKDSVYMNIILPVFQNYSK